MRGAWSVPGVVLALAGCGRFGFQDRQAADGAGPFGDTITLLVTSDEYLAEPAGLPIRDATVLIDRGGGTLERARTDDTGTVQFAADGAVAYHVVYRAALGWRVYTAESPQPGTFELGGRPAVNLNRSMTVVFPPAGVGVYHLRVPEQCAIPPSSSTPTFSFSFQPECEGRRVRMVAFRRASGISDYLDAGDVALVHGSSYTVTGSYQPSAAVSVAASNLPGATLELAADVVARAGVDLTPMTPIPMSAVAMAGTATVMTSAAAGGNALRIDAFLDLLPAYASTTSHVAPATIMATMAFDASALPPPFTSLTVDRLPALSWTGGGTGGSWIALEAITGMLQWNAYVPPSATSVTFPALPADLGVPAPASFAVVLVTKLHVPGVEPQTLARSFDRTWREWPNSAELLPPGGGSRAQIRYLAP